ncbi:hypothetical protein ACKWTF_013583 [Chironomus riparius]
MFGYSEFANFQGANSTINNNHNKRRLTRIKKRNDSYRRYLHRLLRKYWPEKQLASKTIAILDDFIMDIFLRIARQASDLVSLSKRKTLLVRDIEASIRLILVGGLLQHAIIEGKRSTSLFEASHQENLMHPDIK